MRRFAARYSRATNESRDAITVAQAKVQCTQFLVMARSLDGVTVETLLGRYRVPKRFATEALAAELVRRAAR